MAKTRSYQDSCPVALGMDLLGERWALLVVRELLLGPKRFSALRAGLPGASADMVTARLRDLVEHGVVRRRRLPPPASSWAYELTEWGAALEPIVTALARWSMGSAELAERADRPLSVDSAVLSMRALFDPIRATGAPARLALRLDDQLFAVVLDGDALDVRRADAVDADLALGADPATFVGLLRGALDLADEHRRGRVAVSGDRAALAALLSVFGPQPAGTGSGDSPVSPRTSPSGG